MLAQWKNGIYLTAFATNIKQASEQSSNLSNFYTQNLSLVWSDQDKNRYQRSQENSLFLSSHAILISDY